MKKQDNISILSNVFNAITPCITMLYLVFNIHTMKASQNNIFL